MAPASWQRYSLARVGRFGEVLRLRSSASDRPRTASRTSAGVGLAWLVGRFAGAQRLQRGRKAGAGRGEGAELRLGRLAGRVGVADGRRSGRGGVGRRSTAAAAVFVLAARGGAARGWWGCEAARGSAWITILVDLILGFIDGLLLGSARLLLIGWLYYYFVTYACYYPSV